MKISKDDWELWRNENHISRAFFARLDEELGVLTTVLAKHARRDPANTIDQLVKDENARSWLIGEVDMVSRILDYGHEDFEEEQND